MSTKVAENGCLCKYNLECSAKSPYISCTCLYRRAFLASTFPSCARANEDIYLEIIFKDNMVLT